MNLIAIIANCDVVPFQHRLAPRNVSPAVWNSKILPPTPRMEIQESPNKFRLLLRDLSVLYIFPPTNLLHCVLSLLTSISDEVWRIR